MKMGQRQGLVACVFCLIASVALGWTSVAQQKGMGDATGIGRAREKPEVKSLSGSLVEVKTGACEKTTGKSVEGSHLILSSEDGKLINLHLGPTTEVEEIATMLKPKDVVFAEAFRTSAMPEGQFVAKTVRVGERTFNLRDDMLRPKWAGRYKKGSLCN